ncbi:unnamed protein product, partial [Ranitomeya imitator]
RDNVEKPMDKTNPYDWWLEAFYRDSIMSRPLAFSKLRQDMEGGRLNFSPNLSPLDFQALQYLRNDRDIMIKPAEKGGAIVFMNRTDYLKIIYAKLTSDPTSTIRDLIKNVFDTYWDKGVIDNKTQDFLTKTDPICPVFYILPKVHKNLEHPPGRPIVASIGSILSPFLEKILTPLIRKLPSFLLDTGDFLHEIQQLGVIPRDSLLVSLDVKDLYISIPHLRGNRHLLTNLKGTCHPVFSD